MKPLSTVGALIFAALLGAGGCAGTKGGNSSTDFSIDPTAGPAALVALADSAIAMAEPELARLALARASQIAPSSAAVVTAQGRYFTAVYRYKDAKSEFERAAALDPSSPEPQYWLGMAYLQAGSKEQAFRSFSLALRADPTHQGAQVAIRPLLEDRYRVAGIPVEYASLAGQTTINRGELGVMLAVELGLDPDRTVWRSDQAYRTDWPAIDAAWGSRWLKVSVARGWTSPMADGDLHLEDPVTRGAFAILIARIDASWPRGSVTDSARLAGGAAAGLPPYPGSFSDLGPRHYLLRPAGAATSLGLPVRDQGRFEPQSFVTGWESLRALRGLARSMGVVPIVSGEPTEAALVK